MMFCKILPIDFFFFFAEYGKFFSFHYPGHKVKLLLMILLTQTDNYTAVKISMATVIAILFLIDVILYIMECPG